jgi:hypothetical protein
MNSTFRHLSASAYGAPNLCVTDTDAVSVVGGVLKS